MKDVIAREFFNPFFAFDIETLENGVKGFLPIPENQFTELCSFENWILFPEAHFK